MTMSHQNNLETTNPSIPYISVIIPAYNEEGIIENSINQVAEFLFRFIPKNKSFEIVVVDDGSTDTTGEIVQRLSKERDYLFAVHHKRNFGRGKGVRSGFEMVRGEYIFTIDADLSYVPEHIGRLLAPLERGEADIVLASAYHKEGSISNVPFWRKMISKIGNKLLSFSLEGEFKTVTCIVRGYTKEVINSLVLFSIGKDIHLEIIQKARLLGFRIVEIPAVLRWKNAKRTHVKKTMSSRGFRQMAARHMFYNFLFRPSMVSWFPVAAVGAVFLTVSMTLIKAYVNILMQQPVDAGWISFYFALREHILHARVSYFVWSLSLLLLFQFGSLMFIAKQNNHHYEEMFSFLSQIHTRLRNIEGRNR